MGDQACMTRTVSFSAAQGVRWRACRPLVPAIHQVSDESFIQRIPVTFNAPHRSRTDGTRRVNLRIASEACCTAVSAPSCTRSNIRQTITRRAVQLAARLRCPCPGGTRSAVRWAARRASVAGRRGRRHGRRARTPAGKGGFHGSTPPGRGRIPAPAAFAPVSPWCPIPPNPAGDAAQAATGPRPPCRSPAARALSLPKCRAAHPPRRPGAC